MLITKETDYAVRCVLALSVASQTLRMAQDIAQERMIPKSFILKILQKLARAKLVKSCRGAKGGFLLAVRPEKITLLDVIRAIQGDVPVTTCVVDRARCSLSNRCSVHPVWAILREDIVRKLGSINFQKLHRDETAYKKGKMQRRRT